MFDVNTLLADEPCLRPCRSEMLEWGPKARDPQAVPTFDLGVLLLARKIAQTRHRRYPNESHPSDGKVLSPA